VPGELIHAVATAGEVAQARALFEEYAAQLGVSLCFQDFDHELATLPGSYAPPRGGLWLASACGHDGAPAGEPYGCVALRPLAHDGDDAGASDAAEIKRLYVRPSARGTGLGRRLAEAALAGARARGYRVVKLDTLAQMHAARALYVDLGFRPCAAYYHNPLGGTLYMQKLLD
jgi:ribosomal protein S18 acetylase RimI-like enzyme